MKVLVHHGVNHSKHRIKATGGPVTSQKALKSHFQFTRRLVCPYVCTSVCTAVCFTNRLSDVNITFRVTNVRKTKENVRKHFKYKFEHHVQIPKPNSCKYCRNAKRTKVSIYRICHAKEIAKREDAVRLSTCWPLAPVSTFLEDTPPLPRAAVPILREGNLRHGRGFSNLYVLFTLHKIPCRIPEEYEIAAVSAGELESTKIPDTTSSDSEKYGVEHGVHEEHQAVVPLPARVGQHVPQDEQHTGINLPVLVSRRLMGWQPAPLHISNPPYDIDEICVSITLLLKVRWKRCFQPSQNHCCRPLRGRRQLRRRGGYRKSLQVHKGVYIWIAIIRSADIRAVIGVEKRGVGEERVSRSAGWKQCFQQPHDSCHVSKGKITHIGKLKNCNTFRSCVIYHVGRGNYNAIIING